MREDYKERGKEKLIIFPSAQFQSIESHPHPHSCKPAQDLHVIYKGHCLWDDLFGQKEFCAQRSCSQKYFPYWRFEMQGGCGHYEVGVPIIR